MMGDVRMQEYYSTADAAKICGVTRFSVINWTNKGILKTTKTPGGHRRICRADLGAFIKTYDIGVTAFSDKELTNSGLDYFRCWEFYRSSSKDGVHNCKQCVVYLSDTRKCYTLRGHMRHQKMFCKTSCTTCEYRKKTNY